MNIWVDDSRLNTWPVTQDPNQVDNLDGVVAGITLSKDEWATVLSSIHQEPEQRKFEPTFNVDALRVKPTCTVCYNRDCKCRF